MNRSEVSERRRSSSCEYNSVLLLRHFHFGEKESTLCQTLFNGLFQNKTSDGLTWTFSRVTELHLGAQIGAVGSTELRRRVAARPVARARSVAARHAALGPHGPR